MRSIHASMEPQSACGDHSQVAPAFAANTGSGCGSGLEVEVGKEFIQKRFTLEDGKIATDFRHVHGSGIGTQQGPDIVQVTQAPGVVDIALQLEAHQTLYETLFVSGGNIAEDRLESVMGR